MPARMRGGPGHASKPKSSEDRTALIVQKDAFLIEASLTELGFSHIQNNAQPQDFLTPNIILIKTVKYLILNIFWNKSTKTELA